MVKVEKITSRLNCKVEQFVTGTFRTYRMDGVPVLRHDRGYEWFNYEAGDKYIDCRRTGNYDRTISREEFERLLEEYKRQPDVNKFHIETYTMPMGCKAWIGANHFPHLIDEEKVYAIWQGMVDKVKRAFPQALVLRSLERRTAEEAFCDRESSICNSEWLIEEKGKPSWKYRVTMYVTKTA